MLTFTDSPIPRALIAVTAARKTSAATAVGTETNCSR